MAREIVEVVAMGGEPREHTDPLPPTVAAALARLDYLVSRLEEHPEPVVRDYLLDLLQSVDTIHRAGLRRLDGLLKVAGLQRRALDDPEVKLLFDLYDLGEGGERQRAEAVLSTARGLAEAQGWTLDLVGVAEGVVSVRVTRCTDATDADTATARALLERTFREGLPDFERLEVVEGPRIGSRAGSFVPLASLRT